MTGVQTCALPISFVIHGEPEASEALRFRFDHELKWPVTVPEHRDTWDLDSNTPQ